MSPIPPHIYRAISLHLDDSFAAGRYLKDGPPKQGEAPPAAPNILSDPGAMDGMMAGMKTQMVMMVPQMVIMGWINFFFQGFVLSECLRHLNNTTPISPAPGRGVGECVFRFLASESRTRPELLRMTMPMWTDRILSAQLSYRSP